MNKWVYVCELSQIVARAESRRVSATQESRDAEVLLCELRMNVEVRSPPSTSKFPVVSKVQYSHRPTRNYHPPKNIFQQVPNGSYAEFWSLLNELQQWYATATEFQSLPCTSTSGFQKQNYSLCTAREVEVRSPQVPRFRGMKRTCVEVGASANRRRQDQSPRLQVTSARSARLRNTSRLYTSK
jgi:hypothetical protein